MSVIVKGMEMPRDCNDCPCFEREWFDDDIVGFCKAIKVRLQTYKRLLNCPLIEVPTPHGRLGDLDALWDRMYKYIDNEGAKMPFGYDDFMIHRDSACELIEDAPTVIEAEGSEE